MIMKTAENTHVKTAENRVGNDSKILSLLGQKLTAISQNKSFAVHQNGQQSMLYFCCQIRSNGKLFLKIVFEKCKAFLSSVIYWTGRD